MNKKIKLLPLLICFMPLSSCSLDFAWWEDNNIKIEKNITLTDAQKNVDKTSKTASLINSYSYKYTKKSYYKEYLGKFATETDSDQNMSCSQTMIKYDNNIIVDNMLIQGEESFLNAKSVNYFSSDIYSLINEEDNTIIKKSFSNNGYGEVAYQEISNTYTNNEKFKNAITIGTYISSSSINWDKATYGFSKKDDVIIETMEMQSSTYYVKFNAKTLSNFVTNKYKLYRLKPIDNEGEQTYIVDYVYEKIEKLIGSSIFDEPLNEPFLLEKEETTKTYNITKNGTFDLTKIPEVPNN